MLNAANSFTSKSGEQCMLAQCMLLCNIRGRSPSCPFCSYKQTLPEPLLNQLDPSTHPHKPTSRRQPVPPSSRPCAHCGPHPACYPASPSSHCPSRPPPQQPQQPRLYAWAPASGAPCRGWGPGFDPCCRRDFCHAPPCGSGAPAPCDPRPLLLLLPWGGGRQSDPHASEGCDPYCLAARDPHARGDCPSLHPSSCLPYRRPLRSDPRRAQVTPPPPVTLLCC
jgi:hypothetical protein